MWYLLLILTMTLGSLLIYSGSKHQALLAKPLPWQAKLLGTLLLLLALLGWGLLLTASAALFFGSCCFPCCWAPCPLFPCSRETTDDNN